MSVCVIVMGSDTASRLVSMIDVNATVASAGGAVTAGCARCIQTQRVIVTPPSATAEEYSWSGLTNAELKPAETYVFTFPLRSDAENWFDAQVTHLVGKTMFIVDAAS